MKLKPPLGGDKSLNHSFNRFAETAESFSYEASDSVFMGSSLNR